MSGDQRTDEAIPCKFCGAVAPDVTVPCMPGKSHMFGPTARPRSAGPVPMTSSACETAFSDRASAEAPKGDADACCQAREVGAPFHSNDCPSGADRIRMDASGVPLTSGRRQEVIEQLCKMMGRAWQTIDPHAHNASDCVCRSNATNEGGKYRNAGHALTFMEEAVSAHIAKYEREQRSADVPNEPRGPEWGSAWLCLSCNEVNHSEREWCRFCTKRRSPSDTTLIPRRERATPVTEHAVQEALAVVNDHFGFGGAITHSGAELKGITPDGEGDVSKTYLSAGDCEELANAFHVLSLRLAKKEAT